jgi:sugar phosphate isomerase/epimerase
MHRRKFLQSAAALSVTAGALDFANLNLEAKKRIFGIQLYSLRDDIKSQGITKVVEAVAKMGYKQVEGYTYHDNKIFDIAPKEFLKLLKDNGLTMPSAHLYSGYTDYNGGVKEGTMINKFEKACEDAVTMGQQYIILAYLEEKDRDYPRLIDLLNKNGHIAKKFGLQMCYHNHAFEFETLDGKISYDTILKKTDANLVKFELDLYWITRGGQDAVAYFKKYPGRFPLWHCKDMDHTNPMLTCPVGEGRIDFQRIFNHATLAGLKHPIVELEDYVFHTPLEGVEMALRSLEKLKA